MNKELAQLNNYLPPLIKQAIADLSPMQQATIEEIRFNINSPLLLRFNDQEGFLQAENGLVIADEKPIICDNEIMRSLLLLISDNSFYALDEELRRGYITLPGGHRAGLCGRVTLENGLVKGIRDISSVNIRLARPIYGSALKLLPYLTIGTDIGSSLIVAAPRAGKSTLLRDLIYQLSEGTYLMPKRVGVVDERSELAALYRGIPQLDIGKRSDILDGCPKAEGLMMMIRSMSPQVLACDEIGRMEDALALREAANAGIKVLATAHGDSPEQLMSRPVLSDILKAGDFERIIFLSRRKGPGTIESIYDGNLKPLLRGDILC